MDNNSLKINANKNYKFALDIGTRTMIGIVTTRENGKLLVIDSEIMTHPDRNMYDGQVHDIMEVSKIATEIKEKLEERNNLKFEKVSIAAAGRALKTERVDISKNLDPSKEIDAEFLDIVEMEALQVAQDKMKTSVAASKSLYYCVGYSVVSVNLDGINIKNPIGHSASVMHYSLVATFLPHSVSDTLYKVVSNMNLVIESMTLEPIAALEVSVPHNLRLLNLAIVDIGAGTSDIALTKGGNIYSYGMVDVAGDEISEALMLKYLLDFNDAEKLKLSLINGGEQEFTDILENTYKMQTEELISSISDVLDNIAQKIASCILDVNKQSPDAVFLIGGSSQMPTLRERISAELKLENNKISLKSANNLPIVKYISNPLDSPEYVTPLGIAYMSQFVRQRDFISVIINGKTYRLYSKKNLSAADALVLAGFNAKRLIQTRGASLSFKVDGEEKNISGEAGEPSKILINGVFSSINDSIKHGDLIEITRPIRGADAYKKLGDVLNFDAYILQRGEKHKLIEKVLVNGEEKERAYNIQNGDFIEVFKRKGLIEKLSDNSEGVNEDISDDYNDDSYVDESYVRDEYYDDLYSSDVMLGSNDLSNEVAIEEQNTLNITVNSRVLKIKLEKDTYKIKDLFNFLGYDKMAYNKKLVATIDGQELDEFYNIKNFDKIDINFKK